MKKSTHPKTTHLGDPKTTPYVDHILEIIQVDNTHNYEMRCVTCDKHIKWATELEYLWLNWITGEYKKRKCKFRTIWWAPRYDETYQKLNEQLYLEKMKG